MHTCTRACMHERTHTPTHRPAPLTAAIAAAPWPVAAAAAAAPWTNGVVPAAASWLCESAMRVADATQAGSGRGDALVEGEGKQPGMQCQEGGVQRLISSTTTIATTTTATTATTRILKPINLAMHRAAFLPPCMPYSTLPACMPCCKFCRQL